MQNLLASTGIGTLYLDSNLNIRRFTPAIAEFMNLIKTDVGRPVSHIVLKTNYDRLFEDATEVLRTLVPRQIEVHALNGKSYGVRILPYKTIDNAIDGVVITFTDVTEIKASEIARRLAENIVNAVRSPLLVLDKNLKVVSANACFYHDFTSSKEMTTGKSMFEINKGDWDIPEFRNLLEQVLPNRKEIDNFILEQDFGKRGKQKIIVNARQIDDLNEESSMILVSFEIVPGIENK
jgi:two-component system CheB/CheR fusion protein